MFYHSGANFKNSKKGLIPDIFNIGQLNNLSVVRNFYEYLVLIIIFREEDDELVKPITWRRAPAPVLPVLDRYKSCPFRLRQIFIRSFPSQTSKNPVLPVLDRYSSAPSRPRQIYILSFPSQTDIHPVLPFLDSYTSCPSHPILVYNTSCPSCPRHLYILSFPSQTVIYPVLPVLGMQYASCRFRPKQVYIMFFCPRQVYILSFPSQTHIHPVLSFLDRFTCCSSRPRQV